MKYKIGATQVAVFISKNWSHHQNKKIKERNRRRLTNSLKNKLSTQKHFSISHTEHFGGFALARKPVGFDLELRERPISERAANRIGSKSELAIAHPLELWVMKEAAWKALRGSRQPQTVSQIKIISVKKSAQKNKLNYSFKVSNSNSLGLGGKGVVLFYKRLIMGIAMRSP